MASDPVRTSSCRYLHARHHRVVHVRSAPPSATNRSLRPLIVRPAVSLRLPFLPAESTSASAYVTLIVAPAPPLTRTSGNAVVIVPRSRRMLTREFAGIVAGKPATDP